VVELEQTALGALGPLEPQFDLVKGLNFRLGQRGVGSDSAADSGNVSSVVI